MTSDMPRFDQSGVQRGVSQFIPKSEPIDAEEIDHNQNSSSAQTDAQTQHIYRMSEDNSKLMGALKGNTDAQQMVAVTETYQRCGICQFTCDSADEMNKHVAMHDINQQQPPAANNAIAQAMAAAEQDTEAEQANQQLVIHAEGGAEDSQYLVTTTLHVCAICGKAYTQKDGLDEHMQSHASRLYSCSLCGAIFIDKTHLDVHMRSHYAQPGTGDKMIVVEDSKDHLRQQTMQIQGNNGQMLQVQVPNNNNKAANGQMEGEETQQQTTQQQPDVSVHRCPLCSYVTTSVNEFCKHVVLHAEGRHDGPQPGEGTSVQVATSESAVTIQPAATATVQSGAVDKPQITIVAASGNGSQTVAAQPQSFNSPGQSPQYRCSMCGELFSDNNLLQTHMRSHQETTRLFSCSLCGVVYANRQQLETHMQSHMALLPANSQQAIQQQQTQQTTVNGETRQVLIQTAGGGWIMKQESTMSPAKPKERPYPCPTCGKTFCQKAHLENHLRIHTGERPFACSMCGKAFRRKEHIGRHMRIHTGERPFCCSHCGKRFSQRVHLESHIRIHTGERPFSCSACGKTFTRKEHIERHIKTHTGERMFVCSQCGKSFNQKAHLESHMRTHTGERPYTCGPCGKTFRQRVQLERHARTHLPPGTEGILTTSGGQQVLTVAAVPGQQQVAFVADPSLLQQLQTADGHTTITIPACTLCGKAFCQHMDQQHKSLIAAAAAQGATVQVLAAPGQQIVDQGTLQVVDGTTVQTDANATATAVAQAVAQATGIEAGEESGMSVQEQVDKAISNAVAV